MKTRTCPDCRQDMKELRHGEVAVDACACGGMWFDRDELVAWRAGHAAPSSAPRAVDPSTKPRSGRVRRCPHCDESTLAPVWQAKAAVAQCTRCHGVWLPPASGQQFRAGASALDGGAHLSTGIFEFVFWLLPGL